MKTLRIVLVALIALALVFAASASIGAAPGTTERVSVDSTGNEGDGWSRRPAISADGRYVAFMSSATNLVAGDTNGTDDIFVHDRQTGTTERVSVDSAGDQANSSSFFPTISADGRYVAFVSAASNLVPNDTNDTEDIFVHDCQTGITERVSVDSDGNEANANSRWLAIGADGRYVAFSSDASNLVAGDTNGCEDIFVHDRQTGVTERVSVDSAGNEANDLSVFPAISADGRYVAFLSDASNLVAGDTNGTGDIFVHDHQTGATVRVSVASDGSQGDDWSFSTAISADGRYVAFASIASNLVAADTNGQHDIFIHDRDADEDGILDEPGAVVTERVSVDSSGAQSDDWSCGAALSAHGRHVAFWSGATNLVADDTNGKADVFLHDRQTGLTEQASVDSAGNEGNGDDFGGCNVLIAFDGSPRVSTDGAYVAFPSEASNLVPNDTNYSYDVFVHELGDAVPVGGIAQLPHASGSSARNYIALAALAAAALVPLTAGAWYARRRLF